MMTPTSVLMTPACGTTCGGTVTSQRRVAKRKYTGAICLDLSSGPATGGAGLDGLCDAGLDALRPTDAPLDRLPTFCTTANSTVLCPVARYIGTSYPSYPTANDAGDTEDEMDMMNNTANHQHHTRPPPYRPAAPTPVSTPFLAKH